MALPQAGVELIADGLSSFVADMDKANQAVTDFGKSGDAAGKGFGGFQEIVTGALREVGSLAVDAMGKAAEAVGSFIKDSVGLAGDFQQGMQEFKVSAGKDLDTKGLEKFHDLFIQLGKDLPVSTSDVQQAAIEMVKGGIDPATVAAGGLEQDIKFAAAAMKGDLVGAAEISSKIVAGWADVSSTAADKAALLTHATDLLTKAANASSTDVGQLSQGLFNVQGTARAAGIDLDDVTTVLGELAGDFSSSAEAGTSLKNFITRLQPTTKTATAYMLDLGLITEEGGNKFFDATGKFVGFQQASEILKTSLVGLTDAQRVQYLQQIFGNDAMGAANGLALRGADGYAAFTDQLNNSMGVQQAAATQQDSFNTSLTNVQGSVEALQIKLGEKLLPVLSILLDQYINPAIGSMLDLADAVSGDQDAFNKLSPALQSVATTISTFIGDVQSVVATVQDMIGWFSQAGASSDTLGSAVSDLSGIWNAAIKVVSDVASGYEDIINSVLPIVSKFIDEHGAEISAFFKTAWNSIVDIVTTALNLYDAIVPPILHAIAGFIDTHGKDIQTIIKGAWDAITGIIDGALTLIKGVLTVALDVIHGDWSKAWADLQQMSARFVTDIGQVIQGGLNIIAGFFGSSLSEISTTWQNNWNMMVEIVSKIADRMPEIGRDIVTGIQEGVSNAWGGFISWLEGKVSSIVDSFLKWIGAGSPAVEFMPVGQFATQGIMQGFQDWWPSLMDLVGGLGDDLVKQATDLGTSIQSAIADAFGATASIDRQIAQNLDKFKDVLPTFQEYTTGALKQAEDQARAFLDPTEGAKFFQLRSKQILEYAKLQKDLADAKTDDDRDRIRQQMTLIAAAQDAELKGFNANLDATKSGTEKLLADIQAMMTAKGVNAKGQEVSLPGIFDNPTIAGISSLLWQALAPPANPWANPPMSAQQIYNGGGGTVNNDNSRTWNMPIYTNNSPVAIQQSLAIAQASMP